MTGLDEMREKLERALVASRSSVVAIAEILALPESEHGERIEGRPLHWGIKNGEKEYIELRVPFGSLPHPMPARATLTFTADAILGTDSEGTS